MRKSLKLQPRAYLLNPVMRDAVPHRGEMVAGEPTPALARRYDTYREALMQTTERRRMRMIRRGRGDFARLDMDYAHSMQMLDWHQKRASAPRVLVEA